MVAYRTCVGIVVNAILRAIVSEGPYFIVYLGVMPEYSRIFDGYVSAIEIWVAAPNANSGYLTGISDVLLPTAHLDCTVNEPPCQLLL